MTLLYSGHCACKKQYMDDKEFKLEVLRVTLAHSTMDQRRDIIAEAQKHLDWCLEEIDKPSAQLPRAQSRKPKGQA